MVLDTPQSANSYEQNIRLASGQRRQPKVLYWVVWMLAIVGLTLTSCHTVQGKNQTRDGLPPQLPLSADEIIEGNVLPGSEYQKKYQTWSFTVRVSGHKILARARNLLLQHGFTPVEGDDPNGIGTESGALISVRLHNQDFLVTLSASDQLTTSVPSTVMYVVSKL